MSLPRPELRAFANWLEGELRRRDIKGPVEAAKQIRVAKSQVSQWLNAKSAPDLRSISRIAECLGIPEQDVLARLPSEAPPDATRSLAEAEQSLREALAALGRARAEEAERAILVPIAPNVAVSAGAGAFGESHVAFVPRFGERGHEFVAVPVIGDCMLPEISPGDLAIIDRTAEPRHGEVVAAERDGEYLVKRLEQRNGELWLVANQGQPPMQVTDGVRLLGVVRGTFRRL